MKIERADQLYQYLRVKDILPYPLDAVNRRLFEEAIEALVERRVGKKKNSKTKRFDFKRQLNGMSMISLERLRNYHLDLMEKFSDINHKEAEKHLRYVGYIESHIDKRKQRIQKCLEASREITNPYHSHE